ncbi:type IX secretion system motor protein PorL/GldL [Porphyromonas crevioricanis]|uniref:Gliding motility-associated protein GldL n=2 Tax=Porphyromonas crevioricanis TaxID=393921 RepID=A0A2X4PNA9_9PORP|nr:gliding motility protein GldL [Porphyromonas crevioricanis]SJZ55495.1 gliding motility-associated protein GldL [Porphyromonas crevioricanis]SQH73323.1 gliding motility-associated protein GldL [Porphyromonas crevioricanis]
MGKKYRRYRNRLELFLASRKGRRVLNFFYSWGAAVVIIGALFKLLHLPFGNQMLFVGMMTEFFVFFISAFEKPANEYHWENLFPQLDSDNPMDKEEMEARKEYFQEKARQAAQSGDGIQGFPFPYTAPLAGAPVVNTASVTSATSPSAAGVPQSPLSDILPEDQLAKLKDGIEKLALASEQLARIGQMSEGMVQTYEQLQGMTEASAGYQKEMENLGRNIAGLNTIYEIQLKGISSQIDTIEHINRGLQHIRDMYDGTVIDSSHFRTENERMAAQLTKLNEVYARLLSALTVNMNVPNMGAGAPKQSES